jgi:molybdate transport system substrate-binding protein
LEDNVKHLLTSLLVVAVLLGVSAAARAQKEISLLVPGPMGRDTMPKIVSGFEMKTGYKVKITFAVGSRDVEPYGTKQLVQHGQASDVSIMFAPFPEALASGNVDPHSATKLAGLVLALSVRKGAPKPDISSAAAVKQTLLSAKSIAIIDPAQGTLGHQAMDVLQKLKIADEVKPKLKTGGAPVLAKGDADLFIGPEVSDPVPQGIDVVGAFPKDVATPVEIVGFVSTHAQDPKAAKALLKYLRGPEAEAAYKAQGLLPLK